jgi:predicted metalloprotease with PDZ domain
MRYMYIYALILAGIVMSPFTESVEAQNKRSTSPAEISYTVSMPRPYTHLLEVEMRVRSTGRELTPQTDLVMPVWTPGSYLIREYERHVQDFAATSGPGLPLSWTKVNKNTWRVNSAGQREIVATYRVYCNEFSVRTNEVNDRHAFWNNAALLMYPEGQLQTSSTLRVVPFGDWSVATGLPPVEGQPNTFKAENFDILYDSPFEVGTFKTLSFEVKGIPHRMVIDGEGNYDPEKLRTDFKKIVETQTAMMGDLPYRDYTFFIHLRASGGGGLEHLNSTALIFQRFGFTPESSYQDILSTTSHEFFHLWNVKRIRPDTLGPFNYTSENYTRLLWVAEGITEYYASVMLRRAGLLSDEDYLKKLAKRIKDLQQKPGRLVMSAEEASFDAWIKYYRPDENAVNSQISYYDKGALLGMLLDLEIRRRSGGAKSLDDVIRHLYNDYYKRGRNYTPEDFQRASEQMAGSSLESFFSRYVRGTEELDYNAALSAAGLRLDTSTVNGKPGTEKAFLGAETVMEGDRLIIRPVYSGTPAYDQGLNANDQIVALDGMRVNKETFAARIAEKKPGDVITLTVFRLDDLRSFQIKLGGRTDAEYRIVPVEKPSDEQRRIYEQWLGAGLRN